MTRRHLTRVRHLSLCSSPSFRTTSTGGHLSPTVLTCTKPAYMVVFRWNGVSNLEPSGPEVETLPSRRTFHSMKTNDELYSPFYQKGLL
ncbi:hypothetical protein AVEN_29743-1 [Araneus ventricosus]|uniref:Uncharacterized protein n=1 Tax=Araneus ventricosus TaxID=182803 RepID=A0A4Y2SDU0_ARAVE|nr:hypothetical protein AVEN_29743-1 [Araneus ventricosus]